MNKSLAQGMKGAESIKRNRGPLRQLQEQPRLAAEAHELRAPQRKK